MIFVGLLKDMSDDPSVGGPPATSLSLTLTLSNGPTYWVAPISSSALAVHRTALCACGEIALCHSSPSAALALRSPSGLRLGAGPPSTRRLAEPIKKSEDNPYAT